MENLQSVLNGGKTHLQMQLNAWAALIEFAGALVIAFYVCGTILLLLKPRVTERILAAKRHLAEGVLTALSFKIAATLLKTLLLQSWQQIGVFVVLFCLRSLLKRVFAWEAVETR